MKSDKLRKASEIMAGLREPGLSKERHEEQKWFREKGYSAGYRAGIEAMRDAAEKRCEKQAQYYRENGLYPAYCLNGMEAGAKACAVLMEAEADKLLKEAGE